MQSKASPAIKQRLRAALLRDPKKSSMMAGLAIIILIMVARMGSNGPPAATASFLRRSVAATSDLQSPAPMAVSNNAVLEWLAQPHRQVERNLFAIKLDHYARAGSHGESVDSPEEPEKSPTDATDQERERQILLENLQSQAAKLKLQTTVMGSVATALVNGELVKVGDTVAGFKVVRIEARRVSVEQDGVVLEIEMP
jgi:hypothetical protein